MRNIVLVTVDSLRADHCGFLDDSPTLDGVRETGESLTPTLDGLTDESVVFETAIAPGPRTPSSVPVVFTGEHVGREEKGVYRNWEEKRKRWRDRRERIRRHLARHRTLTERLAERGYATAAVTANPWTATDTGFDRGFDHFYAVGNDDSPSWFGRLFERATGTDTDWLLRWPAFYDAVLERQRALTEPYFLWMFLLDPHQPYLAPRRYRAENSAPAMYYANLRYNRFHGYMDVLPAHLDTRLRRAYRDTVRSVDGFVERLLGDVGADDPVLVVHADHGEAFYEHGTYGHRQQLYEENIHVPLLVHNAGRTGRVSDPVALRHLPRVLDSITGSTFDPEKFTSPFVVSRTEEDERVSVRGAAWKYVCGGDDWEYVRGGTGEALYHLQSDPGERTNLLAERPAVGDAMRGLFDRKDQYEDERGRIARAAAVIEDG